MIVKIQKPISSSEPHPEALVYNESRSRMLLMPWEQCEPLFDGDELKIYVEAEIESGKLIVGARVIADF